MNARNHSRSNFVQLRADYLALADGNHCAAKILSVLEFRTNQLKAQAAALGRAARQWIYKRLVDWRSELMEEHSVGVIRRAIRLLQEKGFIEVTNNFKRNRAGGEFNGQDKTNQYRLNFNKVGESLKSLQRSILSFSTTEDSDSTSQESDLNSEVSETTNIIEDSIANFTSHSIPNCTTDEAVVMEEIESVWNTLQNQVTQWGQEQSDESTSTSPIKEPEQVNSSNETIPHKDNFPAVGAPKIEKPVKRGEQKEVWEIVIGHPYSVFLNWWAKKKYEPQGGKWAADARGNAYSEFYNNRSKTTAVIFPEFLEFLKQTTENCNQQLHADIKALLPSCFIAQPEASEENVQRLMENVRQLVANGAEVALPQSTPTPSCNQSISFGEATDNQIKALPELEKTLLSGEVKGENEDFAAALTRKQILWRTAPFLRGKISAWALDTPGVKMGVDGPEAMQNDQT